MKQNKISKIIDILMRSIYIVVFAFTGIWALFFVESYATGIEISFNNPVGRGEVQAIGGVYLLSALAVLYYWIKQSISDLFKIATLVISAILLSRTFSLLQGEFNEMMIILIISELPLFVWAIWGLRKHSL